jgi:hypothetical protein
VFNLGARPQFYLKKSLSGVLMALGVYVRSRAGATTWAWALDAASKFCHSHQQVTIAA